MVDEGLTTTTFPCPHCGKHFPRLPSLIGRRVRCNGCQGQFRLAADGTTTGFDEQGQPISGQTAPPPPPPPPEDPEDEARAVEQLTQTWTAAATGAIARQQQDGETAGVPKRRRIANRREALKASLNQSLRQAADAAVSAIEPHSVQPEPAVVSSTPRADAASSRRPVETRRGIGLWLGAAGLACCVALIFWFVQPAADPYGAMLRAYAAPAADAAGYRMRGWVWRFADQEAPALLGDLGTIKIDAEPARIQLGRVGALLKTWRGLRPVPDLACFVPAAQVDLVRLAWQQQGAGVTLDAFHAALRKRGMQVVDFRQAQSALRLSGAGVEEVEVVTAMLLAETADHEHDLAARLLDGDSPAWFEVVRFSGRNGSFLVPEGEALRSQPVAAYQGMLLRAEGWPEGWRVFDCRSSQSEGRAGLLAAADQQARSVIAAQP